MSIKLNDENCLLNTAYALIITLNYFIHTPKYCYVTQQPIAYIRVNYVCLERKCSRGEPFWFSLFFFKIVLSLECYC